jgi:hypothetical protein
LLREGLQPKDAAGAEVVLLLPDGKDAPLLPFGKSGTTPICMSARCLCMRPQTVYIVNMSAYDWI